MVGVFAVRFVPDRNNLDAFLRGHHAGAQLRLRLMGEAVADAERVFSES